MLLSLKFEILPNSFELQTLAACLRIMGRLEHPLQPCLEQMLQATLLLELSDTLRGSKIWGCWLLVTLGPNIFVGSTTLLGFLV